MTYIPCEKSHAFQRSIHGAAQGTAHRPHRLGSALAHGLFLILRHLLHHFPNQESLLQEKRASAYPGNVDDAHPPLLLHPDMRRPCCHPHALDVTIADDGRGSERPVPGRRAHGHGFQLGVYAGSLKKKHCVQGPRLMPSGRKPSSASPSFLPPSCLPWRLRGPWPGHGFCMPPPSAARRPTFRWACPRAS